MSTTAREEGGSDRSALGTTEYVVVVPPTAPRGVPAERGAADTQTRHGDLRDRLKCFSPERLADVILYAVDRQGDGLRRIIEEALRKLADAQGPARTEEAEPFMVGSSPAMQRVYDSIRKYAATNAPVLITGESGTGKELVARAIHERSAYGKGPFVAINCAALPPTLIAAELFGYEKGAFTGAVQRRIGRLESAHGGTIFLDEIGDLPLEQQAHLLRFLQEHTIDRVGGVRPIEVNARVICATHADLARAIAEGRFRDDLFYRLHVLSLHLPSLRERGGDIELLATFFLRKFADDHGRSRTIAGFSEDAWKRLREHSWPGNVRELISSVRRAIVMAESPWISARDLGLDTLRTAPPQATTWPAAPARSAIDEQRLRTALQENLGNIANTARALNLSRMTVYRSMRRYGIS
jgi:DNA-binding NtrC family response regulator